MAVEEDVPNSIACSIPSFRLLCLHSQTLSQASLRNRNKIITAIEQCKIDFGGKFAKVVAETHY